MAFLPSAALLPLALLLVPTLPSQAQVSMGYNNPITSTATRARTAFQAIRSTRVFDVEGVNAVPNDGSLVYNESTVWNILNPADPFSLNVNSFDPLHAHVVAAAVFLLKLRQRIEVPIEGILGRESVALHHPAGEGGGPPVPDGGEQGGEAAADQPLERPGDAIGRAQHRRVAALGDPDPPQG